MSAPRVTVVTHPTKGRCLVANVACNPGDVLLIEPPLAAKQSLPNTALVSVCSLCLRPVGSLHTAFAKLLTVGIPPSLPPELVTPAIAARLVPPPTLVPLPAVTAEEAVLAPVLPCPHGCDSVWCSAECLAGDAGHMLLCPQHGGGELSAAALFTLQAQRTDTVFLLAARLTAHLLQCWAKSGGSVEAALAPLRPLAVRPWWAIVAECPTDTPTTQEQAEVQAECAEALQDSLTILRSVWRERGQQCVDATPRGAGVPPPPPLTPVIDSLLTEDVYHAAVAACALNGLEIKIPSPVVDYVHAVQSLPPPHAGPALDLLNPLLAQVVAAKHARRELLSLIQNGGEEGGDDDMGGSAGSASAGSDESGSEEEEEEDDDDDSAYASDPSFGDGAAVPSHDRAFPHVCGTVLFPTIVCANHTCAPNAHVAYVAGNTVGALLARTRIAAGEEVCISYIGVGSDTTREERKEALTRWGFVCDCARCGR